MKGGQQRQMGVGTGLRRKREKLMQAQKYLATGRLPHVLLGDVSSGSSQCLLVIFCREIHLEDFMMSCKRSADHCNRNNKVRSCPTWDDATPATKNMHAVVGTLRWKIVSAQLAVTKEGSRNTRISQIHFEFC